LAEVAARYPRAELYEQDITAGPVPCDPVDMVHAALVFEHTGLAGALDNSLRLVKPGGRLSVILQLPSEEAAAVTPTGVASIQTVAERFQFIDHAEVSAGMALEAASLTTVGVKRFWHGVLRQRAA
jgi:threonine dehydrogenase-like Zn-dependent dehydrogenase